MSYGYHKSSQRGWDSESWSLILGSVWGIRLRLSLFFIIFFVFELLKGLREGYFYFAVAVEVVLFTSVLLHEFGHCFGCRRVGGSADDILLWPLGGLAFCAPPHRPIDNLITTLAGPMVNLALCVVFFPVIVLAEGFSWALFNPFDFGAPAGSVMLWVFLGFKLNYILLLFNLLPIFPFDGGRVLQEVLWMRMGHYKATIIATSIGMVGAVLMAGFSLWFHQFLLLIIAVFGFAQCYQTRMQQEMMGEIPENEFGYDFSQGYTSLERSMKGTERRDSHSLRARLANWQARRRGKKEARLEEQLDRILDKIHNEGIESLSRAERRILQQASNKRRKS